jgi:putative ABC transport system permease protein
VLNDLRFALRSLRKSPGFTAVALLTLALGIGANTAIFSLVYAVLLRPLPYKDAGRVVVLHETTPKVGTVSVSYPNFVDWRSQSRRFSQMAFVHDVDADLGGTIKPQAVTAEAVSASFLSLLDVRPIAGRDFAASEDEPGTAAVAILSYGLWQSRFGGDRGVLGRTITLDGRPVTIVGIVPPDFRAPEPADLLLPVGVWRADHAKAAEDRGARGNSVVVARLAPMSSLAAARVELQTIAARLARAYPTTNDQFGVALQPVRDFFVGDVRPALLVLFGAVLFVLLIACANVANLLLARGSTRAREVALRTALGAGRARLVRQMMTESLVLALLGGAAGLLVASGAIRVLGAVAPAGSLAAAPTSLNGPVLLFTAVIVVLVTCLFGAAPAIHTTRPDVQSELKEGGRTVGGGRRHGRLLAVQSGAEITLALVLLAGAGLMLRTVVGLLSVDPGFRSAGVLTMDVALRAPRYAHDPERRRFWQQLLDGAHAVPGVRSAAVGTVVPFTHDHSRADVTIEGMPLPTPGSFPHPDYHFVSSGYFRTLGIPLVRGRDFTAADDENAPRVGIVNTRLAQQYFPGRDPIGKRFMFGHPSAATSPEWITIVGVAGDTKLYGLGNPSRLEVYVPYRRYPPGDVTLLVQSAMEPGPLAAAMRRVVAAIDPDQPISSVATMGALRRASVGDRRATLMLLSAFSALAVLLAAIGIYGVISYAVAQRSHEIGIRMALGARQRGVLAMVLRDAGTIAVAGIAVGIATAIVLTRTMAGLLYAVSPADPVTLVAAASLLLAIALLAAYLPARRAARVHPMEALRYE